MVHSYSHPNSYIVLVLLESCAYYASKIACCALEQCSRILPIMLKLYMLHNAYVSQYYPQIQHCLSPIQLKFHKIIVHLFSK